MERHCPRGQSPSRVVAPVKKKKKKKKGCDADDSSPCSAEVKDEWHIYILSALVPARRSWRAFTRTQ
jgi:hypothetical protein